MLRNAALTLAPEAHFSIHCDAGKTRLYGLMIKLPVIGVRGGVIGLGPSFNLLLGSRQEIVNRVPAHF